MSEQETNHLSLAEVQKRLSNARTELTFLKKQINAHLIETKNLIESLADDTKEKVDILSSESKKHNNIFFEGHNGKNALIPRLESLEAFVASLKSEREDGRKEWRSRQWNFFALLLSAVLSFAGGLVLYRVLHPNEGVNTGKAVQNPSQNDQGK